MLLLKRPFIFILLGVLLVMALAAPVIFGLRGLDAGSLLARVESCADRGCAPWLSRLAPDLPRYDLPAPVEIAPMGGAREDAPLAEDTPFREARLVSTPAGIGVLVRYEGTGCPSDMGPQTLCVCGAHALAEDMSPDACARVCPGAKFRGEAAPEHSLMLCGGGGAITFRNMNRLQPATIAAGE